MAVGSPFDGRALPLNVKRQWREWAGFFASSSYAAHHDIEYNAIRNAAALIDVSPLFKYRVSGLDAVRLVDRVITRDATKIKPGQVIYTPWCDEHGKVIDDGTIHRLDDGGGWVPGSGTSPDSGGAPAMPTFRWTAADPQLRWLRLNSRGLDVAVDDISDQVCALALQGPLSRAVLEAATGEDFAALAYYRRRTATIGNLPVDVSRTGYTGDLGYEIWADSTQATQLWDALMEAGASYGIRPAGMLALDVVRVEAGLILLEVDYTSARQALIHEQNYSPYEIGLGRLVNLDKPTNFVGRRALADEIDRGGAPRRLVGLELDWADIEKLYLGQGLSPSFSAQAWRQQVPLFAQGRQIGKATSGTWSPILKKNLALGSVPPEFEPLGSRLQIEWTVEGRRGRVGATVVDMPFFDPPRKRE
ncbi:MAG: aminomethyltransferase [Chloroflexota bacterium]|jgi:aminomethyltransferase|nr:aminomethyltransferase [Chloroflexota bacterium]